MYAVARYREELAAPSGSVDIGFLSTRFSGRGYKERMYGGPVRQDCTAGLYDRSVRTGVRL